MFGTGLSRKAVVPGLGGEYLAPSRASDSTMMPELSSEICAIRMLGSKLLSDCDEVEIVSGSVSVGEWLDGGAGAGTEGGGGGGGWEGARGLLWLWAGESESVGEDMSDSKDDENRPPQVFVFRA